MRCALELAGAGSGLRRARNSRKRFAWSCTLLGPIAIGRLLQGGIGTTSRISRGCSPLTVVVSLLNLVLMVRANHLYDFQLEASGYPTTSFYIALGVGHHRVRHLSAGTEARARAQDDAALVRAGRAAVRGHPHGGDPAQHAFPRHAGSAR